MKRYIYVPGLLFSYPSFGNATIIHLRQVAKGEMATRLGLQHKGSARCTRVATLVQDPRLKPVVI